MRMGNAEFGMGKAEKIEGEILGRWEGENREWGRRNGECGRWSEESGSWKKCIAHSVLSKKNIGIWKVDILSEGVYFPTHNTQLTTRNVKLFEGMTNGS